MVLKTRISCGQYACCIIADRIINQAIPGQWLDHFQELQPVSETVTLHLETETFGDNDSLPDGWKVNDYQGNWRAIYVQGGKALFSLQSGLPNEVKVCIGKATENHVRIGIHYGLMTALYRKCIGLHGVTLLCGNEIIILSAPSGTGKTTLAKLLEKYCDSITINGDFALLSPTKDGVIFEPTPFCGSSGRALNHRFRVNRVVFLGQAKENVWCDLSGREAMTRFMSNAFVPDWDSTMRQAVQENILKCMSTLKVNAYDFAPTKEAAETFLRRIEEDSPLCSE